LKTNTLIKDRKWKYVYQTLESIYREECIESDDNLSCIKFGEVEIKKLVWKDYDGKDIPKGTIRLGVMTDVKEGELIDVMIR